ncbi:MAG: GNAT family N-acetyltransferase [Proteobacteria bacterium]|nr:GNAT family N-acetyltransferase [Pseudomonadota bacterium]
MKAEPDLQPTLNGQRVIVRPIHADDWAAMFSAASDPEIWVLHPVKDRYTEPVFRLFFDGAVACGSAFAFVDRATGKIIGSSRYYGHEAEASEIEIGWTFLACDYWGGSYNQEVKQLMLDHAFTFVDTVVFSVGETNFRSRRAMEKIGGVLREGVHLREATGDVPHVVFEIKRERPAGTK